MKTFRDNQKKYLAKTVAFISAVFLSLTVVGQTYKAYFIKIGDKLIIDSLPQKDSTYSKFRLSIEFPKGKSGAGLEGKGIIRYGILAPADKNGCNFQVQIKVTSDSIIIATAPTDYSYDPCRGHVDWSEEIWEIFMHNIKAAYTKKGNRIIIKWNNNKNIIYLSPFEEK